MPRKHGQETYEQWGVLVQDDETGWKVRGVATLRANSEVYRRVHGLTDRPIVRQTITYSAWEPAE